MNRKADFFLLNESIRIDSHNESNRIDSNRELECSRCEQWGRMFACAAHAVVCDWRKCTSTESQWSAADVPLVVMRRPVNLLNTGISWAIRRSTSRSTHITMPVTHRSVFYRSDALPAAQPTASKHWRHITQHRQNLKTFARRLQTARNESVPTQLAQCWFPGLAISNAKI